MKTIKLKQTRTTPNVELNIQKRILHISGVSMPANAAEFYDPLIDWFREYSAQPVQDLTLDMHLEYFNTSTSKFLMTIFEIIAKIGEGNHVRWYHYANDEDMATAGEDISYLIGDVIHVIEKEE